ncbi:GTS1-transcription factor of the Gcs1p Glo3p Sps18p family [Fusarium albosuccineum]|uniref:GTS1-transcription factor of the Gcs1p Glo3p Sps18p family n=1 Tax=Fusarium albosuccineum TaxID=1237068 RepID=A0A8H4KW62_9HYPO|nr:GTS1-transcription factor of the Gcs1p Glo3p Sps18p family [Fusarium albosuccineum]
MSGILSKRQQARNEKVLQELVHNVPGNNMCADCHARNPGMLQISPDAVKSVLGVFLCMRCAAIHRKLGTHISKVKSLSMDSWSNEQVDNMRKVGNVASNNIYNPEHRKPPVPVDADEADSAMERFIRQKYMNNNVNGSGKSRSPNLGEGTPPPLPPKNSTKFGFRSASSIFPLSSKSKKEAKTIAAAQVARSPSPKPPNKPSKVFGATLDLDQPDEMEQKLARLQDMGFHDAKRNALVLKGVNGNLERAIETLVRLGEGGGRPSPLPTPSPREQTLRTSRSLTPLTPGSGGLGLGAGLSVPTRSATDRPTTPSSASTNPFDNLGPAQPQTAQSTGSLQNKNPYGQTNPFGAPPVQQQTDAFSQAFQNMSLSPQQPLFPHHTGGPASQPAPQPAGYQAMAPSAPTTPNGFLSMGFNNNMTYPQPLQAQSTGYNPFFSNGANPNQQQQQAPNSIISVNTNQGQAGYNPFTRSPTRIASPSLGQIPEQTQTSFQSPSVFQGSAVYQSPAPMNPPETATNPFFANAGQPATQMAQQAFGQQNAIQQSQYQPQSAQNPFGQQPLPQAQAVQNPFGQQPQAPTQAAQNPFGQQQFGQQLFGQQPQQQFYQPQRPDKASIMALFNNYPQAVPQMSDNEPSRPFNPVTQSMQPSQPPTIPENQPIQVPMVPVQQNRSVSQPLSPSTNPFMSNITSSAVAVNNTPTASDPFAARSRESMNLGLDLAWTNGRHSPDAFASLSARHA